MPTRKKLLIGIISLPILLSLKMIEMPSSGVLNAGNPIVYGNFTCATWRNVSYINENKYRDCLKQRVDESFWSVDSLRHTAQKNRLNASSLVVEVGGNRGDDTVKFVEYYNPTILSFEPLEENFRSLVDLFRSNRKVEIYHYGFGNRERDVLVERNDVGNSGTSIFRKVSVTNSSKIERIRLLNIIEVMRNISKFRTKNGIIDMISINCEGCEFEILPALIFNQMLSTFRIIQFATHTRFLSESSCIYCQIQQALERTHEKLYYYSKLWEGWALKNKSAI